MYDPTLGIFTMRDPIAADPNLYRYCENDPMEATDPTGLAAVTMFPKPHFDRISELPERDKKCESEQDRITKSLNRIQREYLKEATIALWCYDQAADTTKPAAERDDAKKACVEHCEKTYEH